MGKGGGGDYYEIVTDMIWIWRLLENYVLLRGGSCVVRFCYHGYM